MKKRTLPGPRRARWTCVSLLTLCALGAAPGAFASYYCYGSVTSVAVSPNGYVLIDSPTAGIRNAYLCQIGGTMNGVGPDQCKAILSVLLTAHALGSEIEWGLNDALSCTTHPQYSFLSGWLFGPNVRN